MKTRLGIGGVGALALVLSLLVTGVGITVAPSTEKTPITIELGPQVAEGIAWRAWKTNLKTSVSFDVRMRDEVMKRVYGPYRWYDYPNAGYKTKWRVRARRTETWNCSNYPGWKCYVVFIKNEAPGWSAWGMSMQVTMRWRNGVVKMVPGSDDCRTWAFLVTVKQTKCEVVIDTTGIDTATIRFQYEVGWPFKFGSIMATRGGKIIVKGDGYFGAPQYWP